MHKIPPKECQTGIPKHTLTLHKKKLQESKAW